MRGRLQAKLKFSWGFSNCTFYFFVEFNLRFGVGPLKEVKLLGHEVKGDGEESNNLIEIKSIKKHAWQVTVDFQKNSKC